MLLPLEQNALLTEINEELSLCGFSQLVTSERGIDRPASVYAILNFINAKFPNLELPFSVIWNKTQDFVSKWADHFEYKIQQRNQF